MDQEHTALDEFRRRVDPVLSRIADGGERILGERPTMEHVLLLLFLAAAAYMYWGASEFAPAAQTFPQLMAGATIVFSLLLLARNYLRTAGPLLGALVGAYFVYDGGTTFLDTGDGVVYLVAGVALLVASTVFRERFGAAVESFVAEPVQMMGADEAAQTAGSEAEGDESPAERLDTDADEAREGDATDETDSETESSAMYVYDIDDARGPIVTGTLCAVYMLLTFAIGMLYATPIFVALWTLWVRMEKVRAIALTVLSFVIAVLFYEFVEGEVGSGWLTGWQPPAPTDLLVISPHGTDLLVRATDAFVWVVVA
jgi:hypothetical protein